MVDHLKHALDLYKEDNKMTEQQEKLAIQKIEAEMFCKALEKFHRLITNNPNKAKDFWNEFCDIRKEYLDKLEKLEG